MSACISLHNGAALERVHYFPRQLITASDMTAEQDYFRQKLRRHNRFLHGWGVVCGLEVVAAPTTELPWQVSIEPGYALSPQGDEIYVAEPICFDLARCGPETIPNPCEPSQPLPAPNRSLRRFLAIRYAECPTRPVRVHPAGCGCDETLCETSRIRDDFAVGCLLEPPPAPLPLLLCELRSRKNLPLCPPCAEEPWVVLAEIRLPDSVGTQLAPNNINNFVRRQLYSTALLQAQLVACCCDERKPTQPGLLTVNNVKILGDASDDTGEDLFELKDGPPSGDIPADKYPNAIEVEFSGAAVDESTVVALDGVNIVDPNLTTFRVHTTPYGFLRGRIVFRSANTVRWIFTEGAPFPAGHISVILLGNGPLTIRSQDSRLDGEYNNQTLPSGNGAEGGDFVFTFRVSKPPQPE